jgi:hypothetical protein
VKESFTIDKWLRSVPQGYLRGTSFGRPEDAGVPDELREQGMLRQVCLMDLALFIAAERVSTRVASGLVGLAPDEASLCFLASQTLDEARHFEAFAHRFHELGLAPEQREKLAQDLLSRSYREFFDLLLESVDRGDFLGGVVGLNVILEGMASPLYGYEMRYWRPFDPALVGIIEGAFRDECRHTAYGERHLASLIERDPSARRSVQRRVDELGKKMRDVFADFLAAFVGFYDLAVQEYPGRCAQVEIVPGRRLADTTAEEQVRWLEAEIVRGHRRRLERMGLECSL